MRRSSLSLLRCPRCHGGPLVAEGEQESLRYGPIHCEACRAVFPLAEGILDLLADVESRPSLAQRALELPAVARLYERGVRGGVLRLGLDARSEQLLLSALLAPAAGDAVLELSCGTALHGRALAHDESLGPVLALDRFAAMLREADHQLQESGVQVDLIRAGSEELPIRDGAVARVLDTGSLLLEDDAAGVLREVARVLHPGGRYVAVTLLPEAISTLDRIGDRLGVHRHGERELRALCEETGLLDFERILLGRAIVLRARRAD